MLRWLRDTVLRMFPHATQPGLRRIGQPKRNSPVLVTGNYALTVRRLERVLASRDVWLLVCNSRGINVWCAATGGHLTDRDVIGAIRACHLADRVEHRTLVLPQLAATGIEPHKVEKATGFAGEWGPARLEDLPGYLERGCATTRSDRRMRFPLWERLEMALMWAAPMSAVTLIATWIASGVFVGVAASGVVVAQVFGVFALLSRLPVVGVARWLTYGGAAMAGAACGLLAIDLTVGLRLSAIVSVMIASVASVSILSLDLAGTTPWYPGTINSLGNRFHLELLEERCTGAASCVLVCPRDVLQMNGERRKVELRRADACVRCGACIVQCPENALQFRFEDGRVVTPQTVRTTRVNMLGRRSSPAQP